MRTENEASRVLISYSHDSKEHRETIRVFADRLRLAGIDAWIDQYDESNPPESWPDWMRREIEKSDFVVIVVTENYIQRFNRGTPSGVGSGVRWEGALITADLYHSRRERAKFIPVVLRAQDSALIPSPLNLTSWFVIGESAEADLGRLVKLLLRDPGELPGALGVPNAAADTAFHFDGIHSSDEIDRAFRTATVGDTHDAISQLDVLLVGRKGDEWAYVLFLQGVLHHKVGEVSQAMACFKRVSDTTGHMQLRQSAVQRLEVLLGEFNAYFGEGGPVVAANKWLANVQRGKKGAVWKGLTRELRLVLAQDWIIANEGHPNLAPYDRDELAAELAMKSPTHPLAKDFLKIKLEVLQDHYRKWDHKGWGAAGNPRRIGLDYELVIMSPADDGVLIVGEGEIRPVYPILMRNVGVDWMVASFTSAYPIPGWPPQAEEIPASLVGFKRLGAMGEDAPSGGGEA
ncbi:toll/interleukin-1 receptor domain-containing protein [Streptomyces microflavus]|uniref:toll/interleukin-1 receptor domain-containing protein n=1 Tax=Streptomyces microflavus TaxID=1919 RepID=UPI0029A324E4|nr:toll/interleukin-1 receptor domain-containing protein [Streptomyces microflavus]MDX2407626.1 toll/interleukin-1 receptor domain-containing protein [Streptomyces microflavus]